MISANGSPGIASFREAAHAEMSPQRVLGGTARRRHDSAVSPEPSVNGANVILNRRALETLVGVEVVARALASVPHELSDAYANVTAVGWVPVRAVEAVVGAVAAAEPAWTPERLCQETARFAVQNLMNGLWRVILRFTSDSALVARTPLLYSKTYNVGRLESIIPRPGIAEVTQSGWPEITDLQLVSLAAGIETVLRCAGRSDARVTFKRTPMGASFTGLWSA